MFCSDKQLGGKFTIYQSINLYRKFTADNIFTGYSMLPAGNVLITDKNGVFVDIVSLTDAGEDVTDGYFLLHARLGFVLDVLKSTTTIQFGVENIFDKLYHEHQDWGNIPRPGRNIYIQLKISF